MNQPGSKLTPQQEALQRLALRQAEAFRESLRRLQAIPSSQADREAVADSLDWLSKSDDCLRNWLGGSPSTPFDD